MYKRMSSETTENVAAETVLGTTQQQERNHHQVPHLENPFEQKVLDPSPVPGTLNEIDEENMETKLADAPAATNTGPRKSQSNDKWIGGNNRQTSTSSTQSEPASSVRSNPDEVSEDELNYISTEGPDNPNNNNNIADEDIDNVETKHDIEPEEYGKKRGATHHLAKEVKAATASHNQQPIVIDEEAVQDALIQAAEDAMRYAYEETAKRQQSSSSQSFEQHQLAEILVRQKQGLLRLEDVDNRLQSLESQLIKVLGSLPIANQTQQQQQSLLVAPPSSSPLSTNTVEGSAPELAQHQIAASRTTDEKQERSRFNLPPNVVAFPQHALLRVMQSLEWVRNRVKDNLERINRALLARVGRDSWVNVRHEALVTFNEVLSRIIARVRKVFGVILPEDQRGLRSVYEGLEDRAILAGIVSAGITLWLLARYRRHRLARQQELVELQSGIKGQTMLPMSTWWWMPRRTILITGRPGVAPTVSIT